MLIEGTRFGRIEVSEDKIIHIPAGLVGFAHETRFVLHESERNRHVAWLQSVNTPDIAFPVMDGQAFGPVYPSPSAQELAEYAGLPSNDLALLVIVVARNIEPRLCANLLAPIIIDIGSRTGVQAVLDPREYSAMFVIPSEVLSNKQDEPKPPRIPARSCGTELAASL